MEEIVNTPIPEDC